MVKEKAKKNPWFLLLLIVGMPLTIFLSPMIGMILLAVALWYGIDFFCHPPKDGKSQVIREVVINILKTILVLVLGLIVIFSGMILTLNNPNFFVRYCWVLVPVVIMATAIWLIWWPPKQNEPFDNPYPDP